MENVNTYIVSNNKIVEDNFSLELAEALELSILIGSKSLSIAVIDPLLYRLHVLENYVFESTLKTEQLLVTLEDVFSTNEILKNTFWKTIKIGLDNNKSTLIPESLFDEEHIVNYFKLNCSYNPALEYVLHHSHKNAQIVNLFAIDKALFEFVKSKYSSRKIDFVSLGSLLIEGVLHFEDNHLEPTIFININNDLASFTIKEGNSLRYFNSFHIADFKDLLYYILFIAEEFEYTQENLRTVLWGNTGNENEYVIALKEYINTVTLGHRPKGVSASYKFTDIPNHQYFDILSMPLCS